MADKAERQVRVHYIKSSACVDIPVHGVYGGMNYQTGRCYMAVFSERSPIPKEINLITRENKLEEKLVDGKEGIARIVNSVLYLDINTAIAMKDWLQNHIENFKKENPSLFEGEAKG